MAVGEGVMDVQRGMRSSVTDEQPEVHQRLGLVEMRWGGFRVRPVDLHHFEPGDYALVNRGRDNQIYYATEVSDAARRLLTSLHTSAPARDREIEAEKVRERSRVRFG